MFCTTECWNCEDKNCKHYLSKQELFLDNQLLISVLDEIRKLINEDYYSICGVKIVYPEDVEEILDKVKDL